MTTEEFLDKLDGVRNSGAGWTAKCPAHEDRAASLSVSEGEDGLLAFCHAGCSFEEILKSVGSTKQEPEAIYSYTDEEGNELYQAVRFPDKQFRYRRFDPFQPDTDGEAWVWSMGDVRRVLYRLPGVISADEVFVVEGEKDVESLRAVGKIATCNPMGAGGWRSEYADSLAGTHLVRIVADKDKPGRDHARTIAKSLEGKVGEVRVYEAREGKDVTDHLEAGLALDQLVRIELSEGVRNYEPLNLFQPVPPVDWVVDNLVVGGEATLLIADGGTGKSYFALAMSLSVSVGQDFIGCGTSQGKVVYADEEGSVDLALQRFAELGATDEQKRNIDYLNFAGVDMVRHPEKLIEDVLLVKPRLVVIDSHAKVTRMGEENSNNEMGRAWDEGFLRLARDTGAAVLVIHHTNGMGGTRGASQIRNSADQVLTMVKETDTTQRVYASKPRRMTDALTFEFHKLDHNRYELRRFEPWKDLAQIPEPGVTHDYNW